MAGGPTTTLPLQQQCSLLDGSSALFAQLLLATAAILSLICKR